MNAFMAPKVTLPVIVLLIAAVAGVSGVLALRDSGPTELVIESCSTATDPNCKLRVPAHIHADFALFIDGEQFDFSMPEFVEEEDEGAHPYIHIHPERFTVIHVHLSGTTWTEVFESLGFGLKDPTLAGVEEATTCLAMPDGEELCNGTEKQLRFFINDTEVDGIGLLDVQHLSRVLITYGDSSDEEIEQQLSAVTDQSCIVSGLCKEREIPGEVEPCSGVGACTG
jgi:hypothetical protein